jgi:hypothetical protein
MNIRVYVDDRAVDLPAGMTVRHALLAADALDRIDDSHRPRDQWGNELGLDGALHDGMRIHVG